MEKLTYLDMLRIANQVAEGEAKRKFLVLQEVGRSFVLVHWTEFSGQKRKEERAKKKKSLQLSTQSCLYIVSV